MSPDAIQPIIGFRSWVVKDTIKLKSNGWGDTVWTPGVNVATCHRRRILQDATPLQLLAMTAKGVPTGGDHDAPHENCECGLYAVHDVPFSHQGYGPTIFGAVACWGRIASQPTGFRAEKAMIVALGIPDRVVNDPDLRLQIDLLASEYRCVAVPMCDLRIEARKHGIEMPEEMRPEMPEPESPYIGSSLISPSSGGHFAQGGVIRAASMPVFIGGASSMAGAMQQLGQATNQALTAIPKLPQTLVRKYPKWWQVCLFALVTTQLLLLLLPDELSSATDWLLFAAAVVAPFLVATPLYRLALRLRCVWRKRHFWLDRDDVCPDCGRVV